MNVTDAGIEKSLLVEGSAYSIRKAYLQAIKQFMMGKPKTSCPQPPADIEAYLLYEKQISHQIQDRLAETKSKAAI